MKQPARQPLLVIISACLAWGCGVPALAATPCNTSAHRAFDFWIGEWRVQTPEGKLSGVNLIEREHDGCVLHTRGAADGE